LLLALVFDSEEPVITTAPRLLYPLEMDSPTGDVTEGLDPHFLAGTLDNLLTGWASVFHFIDPLG